MGAEGFVVLPDDDGARVVESRLSFEAPEIARYPSGRPWLVGRWRADEFTAVTSGSVRVALIGWCPINVARLAAGIRTLSDVDALARKLPGNAHLVAVVDGAVRVQGSITGLRSVFYANVNGVTVAADRADVLARVIDAELDEDVLAVRLITAKLPPPLGERSVWRGVHTVPADSYLTLKPHKVIAWWRAPEPELGLADGAPLVRDALEQATNTAERVSADMSGGLDSTSLCFLSARNRGDLVTARLDNGDPANDDPKWAALAAAELPAAEHLVIPRDDLPAMFGGLGTVVDTEAPMLNPRTAARNLRYAEILAERGVRTHLAGHGGDQLFTAPLSYLHTLARNEPRTALRHARGYRARYRWSLRELTSAMADSHDLSQSWARLAGALDGPRPHPRTPHLDWLQPLRAPVWASGDLVRTARRLFTEVDAEPFSHDRGQHGTLANLRAYSHSYRAMARIFRFGGLSLRLPYFDDRVVEAVLAVRLSERSTPWRYKPLLVDAMRGLVPETVLARRTKGEFSVDAHSGFRSHLPEILDLFADSKLAERGLIDPEVLRTRLLGAHRDNQNLLALDATLAAELWLRAVSEKVAP